MDYGGPADGAMPPIRRNGTQQTRLTLPVGDCRSARLRAGRHDVGAGRGCCASARGRRRSALHTGHERGRTTGCKAKRQNNTWNPSAASYSERWMHIG